MISPLQGDGKLAEDELFAISPRDVVKTGGARMGDLQDALEANTRRREMAMPAADHAVVERARERLVAAGVGSDGPRAGDPAPPFALPNALGEARRSEEMLARGPLVVSFYRGGWCSYCNLELRALQARLGAIRERGANLVAISPELPDEAVTTRERLELAYEVLSDIGNCTAQAYGLVFTVEEAVRPVYLKMGIDLPARNGDSTFELPVPGTFVVDRDGRIVLADVDPDYRNRLEPAAIVAALDGLD